MDTVSQEDGGVWRASFFIIRLTGNCGTHCTRNELFSVEFGIHNERFSVIVCPLNLLYVKAGSIRQGGVTQWIVANF